MKFLMALTIAFLFIGCQTSTTNDVGKSNPLDPQVLISNVNKKSDGIVDVTLQLRENNNFYSNVNFNNIKIGSNECNLTNVNYSPTSIQNGDSVNFEANASQCSTDLSQLEVNFTENANYVDTNLKTVSKSFTKEVSLNPTATTASAGTTLASATANSSSASSTQISYNPNIHLKIANVQPSSINLKNGDEFTFYVYTFDDNSNPVSVPVKINPPLDNNGNIVGEFNNYLIQTDDKGKGSFTYTAPVSLNENNITLTVPVTFNNDVEKNLTISLNKQTQVTVNPTKLILVPNSLTIASGSSYKVTILTLDDDNRGISSNLIISHPIDKNGTSWGSFDRYNLSTNENGEATVTFTAEENLNNIENNLSVPITIESTGLTTNLLLSKAPSSTEEKVHSYEIKSSVPSSVQIESDFDINIQILDKDTQELIDDSNISEINITSENHLVYFDKNSSKFKTTIVNNNLNIPSTSLKISGIDIIDINASVDDNGTTKIISKQVPIVVISGPVSAISINSVSSNYNSDTGLFEHIYSIHAVDKYSNPAQAGTKITVGAVVNPKKIGDKSGELKPVSGSDTSEFNDSSNTFSDDLENNTLIISANEDRTDPIYLGGWIIDTVKDSHTLTLASAFSGDDTDKLSYVIGNERRYNSCGDTLAVADFDSADNTYKTDNNGIAMVKLRFDPYLVGKTISLYANSYQDKRVGVSIKKILLNNTLLTLETNEDDNSTIKHNDGIWERTGTSDDSNGTEGIIYIGTNDGPYNTILNDKETTTLAQNTGVTIAVLTPSICEFVDANGNALSSPRTVKTDCNGLISFDVNYTNDGTCKVGLSGINYEY